VDSRGEHKCSGGNPYRQVAQGAIGGLIDRKAEKCPQKLYRGFLKASETPFWHVEVRSSSLDFYWSQCKNATSQVGLLWSSFTKCFWIHIFRKSGVSLKTLFRTGHRCLIRSA